jgi:hypothetical protein
MMEDEMRSTVMSVTGALALLASVSVSAQAPPPDSVTEVLRQKPRQGMVQEYEASRKKHMAWHKAQNDTWAWDVFEITTGPDTGGYIITSGNHQWKEMEQWDAKMGDADGADSRASMGATIDSSQRSYWTQLNSISRLPAPDDREPLLTVTFYHTKPGSDAALRAVIGQISAALESEKFPIHTIWYVLANGGAGPTYAVVAPRAGLGEMAPSPSLLEALQKHLGKPGADAAINSFYANIVSTESELLRRRPDLSYVPK